MATLARVRQIVPPDPASLELASATFRAMFGIGAAAASEADWSGVSENLKQTDEYQGRISKPLLFRRPWGSCPSRRSHRPIEMEKPTVRIRSKVAATTLIIAILAAVVVHSAQPVFAAEPVVVVSINKIDELLSDVQFVMEATGTAGIGQMFMPNIKNFTQGLNMKKPLGLILTLEGGQPKPLAFLPVEDLDTFLNQVKEHVGEAADAGDGILELQGRRPVFVKEKDGWAFVGQDVESLSDLPSNPQKLLDGLHEQYDIGARVFVQNIPAELRQMAVAKMTEAMEQGLDDAEDEASKELAEAQVGEIKKMIEQADQVTVGWNIDAKNKQTYFDFAITAQPNTELAGQFATLKSSKTKYSGFIVPDAAVSANMSSVIPQDQIATNIQTLDSFEKTVMSEIDQDEDIDNDTTRENAKQVVKSVFDILRDTIKTGHFEGALSIILQDKAMTLGYAAHVADAKKVEEVFRDMAELAKSEPDVNFSKLKFNAGQHGDVRLHELAVPIPDDEYIGRVLDGELEICLGAAQNDVYVAIGTNPVENLKKMIDNCKASPAKEVQPFAATVKLTPILKFAEAIDSDVGVGSIVKMLETTDKDHIRINANSIENGAQYRFLIEEGVLKAIGQAAQMRMTNGF
jgi:hypothetical protein